MKGTDHGCNSRENLGATLVSLLRRTSVLDELDGNKVELEDEKRKSGSTNITAAQVSVSMTSVQQPATRMNPPTWLPD